MKRFKKLLVATLVATLASLLAVAIITVTAKYYDSNILDYYISVPVWLLLLATTVILSLFWFLSRRNNVKRAGIEMIYPNMTEKLVKEMFKEGSNMVLSH